MLEQVEVARDSEGYWVHPEVQALLPDEDAEGIPAAVWDTWTKENAIETTLTWLESEPEDHPAWKRYFDEGEVDISDWNPEPPGPRWQLLAISCTDDGPCAWWYRPVQGPDSVKEEKANGE